MFGYSINAILFFIYFITLFTFSWHSICFHQTFTEFTVFITTIASFSTTFSVIEFIGWHFILYFQILSCISSEDKGIFFEWDKSDAFRFLRESKLFTMLQSPIISSNPKCSYAKTFSLLVFCQSFYHNNAIDILSLFQYLLHLCICLDDTVDSWSQKFSTNPWNNFLGCTFATPFQLNLFFLLLSLLSLHTNHPNSAAVFVDTPFPAKSVRQDPTKSWDKSFDGLQKKKNFKWFFYFKRNNFKITKKYFSVVVFAMVDPESICECAHVHGVPYIFARLPERTAKNFGARSVGRKFPRLGSKFCGEAASREKSNDALEHNER